MPSQTAPSLPVRTGDALERVPDADTGNRGAVRLKDRDFPEECRVLISASDALSRFFTRLIDHLNTGLEVPAGRELPDRPTMPSTWQQQDSLAAQAQAKQKPPPRPSGA